MSQAPWRVAPRTAPSPITDWDKFAAIHPRHAEWLQDRRATNEFAQSLINWIIERGDLTPKQFAALDKIVNRDAQAAEVEEARETFDGLLAVFDKRRETGKRFALILGEVVFSAAPLAGRNPGGVYVKRNGVYKGKIMPGAGFNPFHCADDDIAVITEAATGDLRAKAIAHGRKTGICSCCGAELTKQESIDAGIGPICANKWGF